MRQSNVPRASSPAAEARMRRQRRDGTAPEIALRRALHRRGLRYVVQAAVVPGTRRRVDIAFTRARVAVDVRGCYWHACPEHGTGPAANAAWWRDKLDANTARDADTQQRLESAGWRLIVVWEHDDPDAAADLVAEVYRQSLLRKGVSPLGKQ